MSKSTKSKLRTEPSNKQIIALVLVLFVVALFLIHIGIVVGGHKPWRESVAIILNYRGALPAAVAAIITLAIASRSLNQKSTSDDRSAYYDRVQWAVDLTLDENPVKQNAGWHFLAPMLDSGLQSSEDNQFSNAVLDYNDKYNPRAQDKAREHDSKKQLAIAPLILVMLFLQGRKRKEFNND